ncbi:MAG: hypothetical protein LUD27_05810 [Clostridia bacterium]|nr:hypothetical protein [Clostridia bacterium]
MDESNFLCKTTCGRQITECGYECAKCGNHVCKKCAEDYSGLCPFCSGKLYLCMN